MQTNRSVTILQVHFFFYGNDSISLKTFSTDGYNIAISSGFII